MAGKSVLPTTGGGTGKKVIGGLVMLALSLIVMQHPTEAAAWFTDLFGLLESAVGGIASFIRHIA